MLITLRENQHSWMDDLREAFVQNRRVCGVAPTGFGKTRTFAAMTEAAASKGKSVYIVAHRYEIVDQISRALDDLGVRHGRIQAGHKHTSDLIQVAMVNTLSRRLDRTKECDLLIIDECHHAVSGTYETIANAWQKTRILGVTASPERLDGKGLGSAFDAMIVAQSMSELISAGYLAKYRYLAPPAQIDLSQIKTRLGDYAIDELASAMDKAVITGSAVSHYAEHLNGLPAIAFCVTVAHAEHVAEEFRAAGWNAASVDGTMERTKRRDLIQSIGDGRLNVLTSCALISEGLDIPVVSGAILLRPTKSLSFYLQAVGRVLRPKPDGSDAIILDHVGAVHRHGLPAAPREWSLNSKKKKTESAQPVATCEKCFRVFPVYPGWKLKEQCADMDRPAGCILNSPVIEKALPEQVDGTLVAITETTEWTKGIDLRLAQGEEWRRLLVLADTVEKLQQVSRARGFKKGWIRHVMRERHMPRTSEKPFVPDRAAALERAFVPEYEPASAYVPAPKTRDLLDDILGV